MKHHLLILNFIGFSISLFAADGLQENPLNTFKPSQFNGEDYIQNGSDLCGQLKDLKIKPTSRWYDEVFFNEYTLEGTIPALAISYYMGSKPTEVALIGLAGTACAGIANLYQREEDTDEKNKSFAELVGDCKDTFKEEEPIVKNWERENPHVAAGAFGRIEQSITGTKIGGMKIVRDPSWSFTTNAFEERHHPELTFARNKASAMEGYIRDQSLAKAVAEQLKK